MRGKILKEEDKREKKTSKKTNKEYVKSRLRWSWIKWLIEVRCDVEIK